MAHKKAMVLNTTPILNATKGVKNYFGGNPMPNEYRRATVLNTTPILNATKGVKNYFGGDPMPNEYRRAMVFKKSVKYRG